MKYNTKWIEKSTKIEHHINVLECTKIQRQTQNDPFLILILKKQYYFKKIRIEDRKIFSPFVSSLMTLVLKTPLNKGHLSHYPTFTNCMYFL